MGRYDPAACWTEPSTVTQRGGTGRRYRCDVDGRVEGDDAASRQRLANVVAMDGWTRPRVHPRAGGASDGFAVGYHSARAVRGNAPNSDPHAHGENRPECDR